MEFSHSVMNPLNNYEVNVPEILLCAKCFISHCYRIESSQPFYQVLFNRWKKQSKSLSRIWNQAMWSKCKPHLIISTQPATWDKGSTFSGYFYVLENEKVLFISWNLGWLCGSILSLVPGTFSSNNLMSYQISKLSSKTEGQKEGGREKEANQPEKSHGGNIQEMSKYSGRLFHLNSCLSPTSDLKEGLDPVGKSQI